MSEETCLEIVMRLVKLGINFKHEYTHFDHNILIEKDDVKHLPETFLKDLTEEYDLSIDDLL